MAYTIDLADAARRHWQAAECLLQGEPSCRRPDIAGYLYGLAAELALKQLLRQTQPRRPSPSTLRKAADPMYAHFPKLRLLLSQHAQGRRAASIRDFAEDRQFMSDWDIAMRYAPRREVPESKVERWRAQAKKAIAAMEAQ
jgi:hypothetical protein